MSKDASKLLKRALQLPVQERAALVRSIQESLNPAADAFIESMRGSLSKRDMPAKLERDPDRKFA
jgi:hypothetical protein